VRICIRIDIDSEYEDPDHPMGVTEDGYNAIGERLCDIGENIDITREQT
jgi:hypothetical protein